MYTLSDIAQLQAHVIKKGQHKLAKEHQAIVDWINKEFDVRVFDFFCEKKERQMVHLILDDVTKIQSDRNATKAIADHFLKYFKSNPRTSDVTKSDVFPAGTNFITQIEK